MNKFDFTCDVQNRDCLDFTCDVQNRDCLDFTCDVQNRDCLDFTCDVQNRDCLFSVGEKQPYPELSSKDAKVKIKAGEKMERPEDCPPEL